MEIEQNKVARRIAVHLEQLRRFSSDEIGTTRLPFTEEASQAARYLAGIMKDAGLIVRADASGAIIGRLEGESQKTIIIGSHYDSVKHGGAFDGIAGIICGIEIARLLIKSEQRLPYSLEIVATNDEEGVRFGGGFFSSKAFLGLWDVEALKSITDASGISLYEAMQSYGLVPENIIEAKWDLAKIKCFLEIHCEQGPVLEATARELGIVDGIVGMRRAMITIQGRADHAGTTPMHMRCDALAIAAKVITKVEQTARAYPNSVATVGVCNVSPSTVNTVAEKVVISLDIRSIQEADIESMEQEILLLLKAAAAEKQAVYQVEKTLAVKPRLMDLALQKQIAKSCEKLGYTYMQLHSGAGHDALQLGSAIPAAMIFVPSKAGRSHCPEEYTKVEDLAKAVLTVLDIIKNLELE